MANKLIVKNSVVAGKKPATDPANKPGELWVNPTDKVIGTFDAAGAPVEVGVTAAKFTAGSVPFADTGGALTDAGHKFSFVDGKGLTVSHNPVAVPTMSGPSVETPIHIVGKEGDQNRLLSDTFGQATYFIGRRANGTGAAPSALRRGDGIFLFSAIGYGATKYADARAQISTWASEDWTDTAQGAHIEFSTTPKNTATIATAMRLEASGELSLFRPLQASPGTALTPGVTYLNHSAGAGANTGLFWPDVDQLAISTSGSEKLRVTSGGNVGIGVSTPGAKLHVVDTIMISGSSTLYLNSGSNSISVPATGDVYHFSAKDTIFQTGPVEKVRITADGKVGIGTSAPAAQLHVRSADAVSAAVFVSGTSSLGYSGAGGKSFFQTTGGEFLFGTADLQPIRFITNGQNGEKMRVTADGKVGIGTTAPTGLLHLQPKTTAAIKAIVGPTKGAIEFSSDANALCFYDGSAWRQVTSTAL
jgi:hypothetical protein